MDLEYILLDSAVMHVRLYLSVRGTLDHTIKFPVMWINQKECLVPPLLMKYWPIVFGYEELILSLHEEELDNGRPERHIYAGESDEGDLGDTTTSLLDESLQSD